MGERLERPRERERERERAVVQREKGGGGQVLLRRGMSEFKGTRDGTERDEQYQLRGKGKRRDRNS